MSATVGLFMSGLLALGQATPPDVQPPAVQLQPGDRVEVRDDRQSIRGRLDELTTDEVVLLTEASRVRLPLSAVQRIDRVGDPLWNGTLIGAAIGGGSAIAAMARACSNTNCADTSANLDPRLTLIGSLIGAGVGAIIDASITGRKTVYPGRTAQPPHVAKAAPQQATTAGTWRNPMIFGRFGYARLTDDEGFLGSGATIGVGAIVPVWRNLAVQVAYDRHDHRRDLEPAGPPGVDVSGGFTGTEQLFTAKMLFFFRSGAAVRPYAGVGIGILDSKRTSEFPTFVRGPGAIPVPGPPEIYRYRSTDAGLGFAGGVAARVTRHLSLLGDLTIDLSHPSTLGSTRLTVGAGWRF